MMYVRIFSFFFLFIVCVDSFAKDIDHTVLENGMNVYVISDSSMPIVSHILLYKVGAADEEYGKSGLAHLLEHMMFRSTKSNLDISSTIQNFGGFFNAFTSSYFTVYYHSIHKNKIADVIKLESDRMQNLNFNDDAFTLERKIVSEERKVRVENSPKSMLIEEMNAAFHRNVRSWQVIGWQHEIDMLTKNDAQSMYDKFYVPNNALLVISGDINLDELMPVLEEHYGKIQKPNNISAILYPSEPKHFSDINLTFADSRVKERELLYFFDSPNVYDKNNIAMLIANHILGSGRTGRLYEKLVVSKEIASYAQSDYEPLTKSNALLSIEVVPDSRASFKQIDTEINNVLYDLVKNGITEEELEIAKSDLKLDLIQMQDGITKKSVFMALYLGMGFDIDYVKDLPEMIDNVDKEQVNKVLISVFSGKKRIKGCLINENMRDE